MLTRSFFLEAGCQKSKIQVSCSQARTRRKRTHPPGGHRPGSQRALVRDGVRLRGGDRGRPAGLRLPLPGHNPPPVVRVGRPQAAAGREHRGGVRRAPRRPALPGLPRPRARRPGRPGRAPRRRGRPARRDHRITARGRRPDLAARPGRHLDRTVLGQPRLVRRPAAPAPAGGGAGGPLGLVGGTRRTRRRRTAPNVHIPGGIGFVWEHDAQLRSRRAESTGVCPGDPNCHRELFARRIGLGAKAAASRTRYHYRVPR